MTLQYVHSCLNGSNDYNVFLLTNCILQVHIKNWLIICNMFQEFTIKWKYVLLYIHTQ